jgi:hypothetical protein
VFRLLADDRRDDERERGAIRLAGLRSAPGAPGASRRRHAAVPFYLSIGVDDGLITTHGAMKRLLQDKGVKYVLLEVPGYGHEWKFWRLSLRNLLPRLFQQGSQVS